METSAELIYSLYTEDFISLIKSEDFYNFFINSIKSGENELSFAQRYTKKQVDLSWIVAIEKAVIPLDNIIRNPRNYIEQVEEIVPIEQARKITQESIRHLAQHTNMIAKVDSRGFVTPNKILNIYKEESFATYENRFIYTLLINVQYFIEKRLRIFQDAKCNYVAKVSLNSKFKFGKEAVNYEMSLSTSAEEEKKENDIDLEEDTSQMDEYSRIERIQKILYDFQHSKLIKELYGCALVKPPIMRTNVLLKNQDFKQALALWQFIETYSDSGLSVELIENNEMPSEEYSSQMYSVAALNYCLLKHQSNSLVEDNVKCEKSHEIKPILIKKTIEEYVNDLTLDVTTVKKIFVDEIKRSSKRRIAEEEKIKAIITRALDGEENLNKRFLEFEKRQIDKEKKKTDAEKLRHKKAYEKAMVELRRKRKLKKR